MAQAIMKVELGERLYQTIRKLKKISKIVDRIEEDMPWQTEMVIELRTELKELVDTLLKENARTSKSS